MEGKFCEVLQSRETVCETLYVRPKSKVETRARVNVLVLDEPHRPSQPLLLKDMLANFLEY
jgi:hypothetical protein